ncbi:hypothetical protein BALOs_0941 [Halobacteriovorax sp. BALOs_7]|nr:hypothetical protein BALOs_0941 [Halobacteriovorax sp. BALOs_7]
MIGIVRHFPHLKAARNFNNGSLRIYNYSIVLNLRETL